MDIQVLHPDTVHPEPGLYSHAFVVEGASRLAFISGQIGVDREGEVVGDDLDSQFVQTYENLQRVAEACGGGMDSIVSLRTFLTDADLLPRFHELRKEHYPRIFPSGDFPANTLLVIDQLYLPELHLEIEAVAVL